MSKFALFIFLALAALVCALVAGCGNRELVEAPNPYEVDVSEYDRIFEATHHVLRDFKFTVERSDYRFGTVLTEPRGASTLAEFWRQDNSTFEQMLFATGNDLRRIVRVTLEPWDASMAQPDTDRETTTLNPLADEVTEDTVSITEPSIAHDTTVSAGIEEIQPVDAEPTQAIVEVERQTAGVNAGVETVSETVMTEPAVYGLRVEVLVEQKQLPDQFITNSATSSVFRRLDEVPYELAIRNIPAEYWQPVGRDVLLENRILAQIIRMSSQLTDLDDFNFIQP